MWKCVRFFTGAYEDVVFINIDETSIQVGDGHVKGNVFNPRGAQVARAVRKRRLSCLTHVAVLCNDDAVQQRLPQIVIGNHVTFPKKHMPALRKASGQKMLLLRWCDGQGCNLVLRMPLQGKKAPGIIVGSS